MEYEVRPLTEEEGFIPRGTLEDYPKGHTACELEKRI